MYILNRDEFHEIVRKSPIHLKERVEISRIYIRLLQCDMDTTPVHVACNDLVSNYHH